MLHFILNTQMDRNGEFTLYFEVTTGVTLGIIIVGNVINWEKLMPGKQAHSGPFCQLSFTLDLSPSR